MNPAVPPLTILSELRDRRCSVMCNKKSRVQDAAFSNR